jgi:hypothetical protein
MRKLLTLLAGCAALAASSLPANSAIVGTFGLNPTSAQGDFSNDPNGPLAGGVFFDQYLFLLNGASFITVTTASNTFASGGITGPNGIQNFTGALYEVVGLPDALPGGDDILRFGPQSATLCASGLCQQLAGSGIVGPGLYYLAVAGIAGTTAGYGGNLSVAQLATPIPGAAVLFGTVLAGVAGVTGYKRRRRASAAA